MTLCDFVIPAKAGIHLPLFQGDTVTRWIPALAGMTIVGAPNLVVPNGAHHG